MRPVPSRPVIVLAACGLQPVVNFALANQINQDLDAPRAALYYVAILVSLLGCWSVLSALLGKQHRGSIAVFLGTLCILFFSHYRIFGWMTGAVKAAGLPFRGAYFVEAALFLAVAIAVTVAARRERAARGLLCAVLVLVSWDGARALSLELSSGDQAEQTVAAEMAPALPRSGAKREQRPNVYYILPDTHPGEPALASVGASSPLFDALRRRGFRVISDAVANATVTQYSMMHLFAMELVLDGVSRLTHASTPLPQSIIDDSPVLQRFRQKGYRYVHVYDGYDGPVCPAGTDICIRRTGLLAHQDIVFLGRTPLLQIVRRLPLTVLDTPLPLLHYPDRLEVPEIITRLPSPGEGPYFLFLHLSLPHPPYRFDRGCNYYHAPYTQEAFLEQLLCAAKLLTELVDHIRSVDPGGIVIVQADTGEIFETPAAAANETVLGWPAAAVDNRLSILSAFFGPQRCLEQLRPGLSPVNTFRWLFSCLEGAPPSYLPDRSWVTRYLSDLPSGEVLEWTKKRAATGNAALKNEQLTGG